MKFRNNILLTAICTILVGQVQAGSEIETLINMLHQNGTVDDAQYARLMDEIHANTQPVVIAKQPKPTTTNSQKTVKLTAHKGGLQLVTEGDEFKMKIGGRVQVDSAWYDENGSAMGNGTEIRRARLYIQGNMFHDWGYKLQYDFTGSGRSGIKDAFLTYKGFDKLELKLGHFKNPFMLQEQTSSKYITFTERALMDTFATGRHLGIMASTRQTHWTSAIGFFGDTVNTASKGKDEGWGVTARSTFAPINQQRRVLHIGVAVDYQQTGDKNTLRFKQQPETHISGTHIVDTGNIAHTDNNLKLGAELALVAGSFSTQAEYVWTTLERDSKTDLDFSGWYVQAAYFLTGESRRYKKGAFAGTSPQSVVGRNGIGAWQLAARYSVIDLNDADIIGGEAESVTVGLNWLPTSTLRFSGNYVQVLEVEGGSYQGEEPHLFQLRGQWAF